MQDIFVKHLPILACPTCRGHLWLEGERLVCQDCHARYPIDHGIPLLLSPHAGGDQARDVTEIVKNFYEENPFPNYDDVDSRESLREKATRGVFAKLLDEQIPQGALVLDAGCGTGQLTNFLGMDWNRRVFGSDLSLNSLRLAKAFQDVCDIKNAGFLQMSLFRPAFQDKVFDLVICNGVLHHTSDPLGGFRSISPLVKPGGVIMIGLYDALGRLPTEFRRLLFCLSNDRLRFLDSRTRNRAYNELRKRAWFMDQYKHPQESKHSYGEVMDWFKDVGFEFLLSIPKIGPDPFFPDEKLFVRHERGTRLTRFLTEIGMLLRGGVDGGLFIMIGRKPEEQDIDQAPVRWRERTVLEG